LAALVTLGPPASALAHASSLATGEVHISADLVAYRLRVAARDLAAALGIVTDATSPMPAAAFDDRRSALARYLAERLRVFAQGEPCTADAPLLDDGEASGELVLVLRYRCPEPVARLRLQYGLFFEVDPTHRSRGHVMLRSREAPFTFDHSHRWLEVDIPGGW
jgi:hypothetical protein